METPVQALADEATDEVADPSRSGWDETPIRTKLVLLLLIATIGGAFLGSLLATFPGQVWPLFVGLVLLLPLLILCGQAWIIGPYDRLAHWLDVQARATTPFALRNLPVQRRDEIGRISRAVHTISTHAIRHHHDAQQLRRTLDARISEATRRACSHLEIEAMRDHLTDLGNRRCLDKALEPMVETAQASHTDLLCIMIDLDDFKPVNDTLGHAMGDQLLQLIASLLKAGVRGDDLAARMGGDEFVLLMAGATMQRAIAFSEQTRKLYIQQAKTIIRDESLAPNLSIGIASLHLDRCESGSELLAKADDYLYNAKNAGKGHTQSVMSDL